MKKLGYSLAEVLITLAVVGVVAAITVPNLIADIKEKQYEAGRQKALSMIGEAGKRIAAVGEMNSDYNAQQFIENTLNKHLKVVKVCRTAYRDWEKCGWSMPIKKYNGTKFHEENIYVQAHFASTGGLSLFRGGEDEGENYIKSFLASNGYSFIMYYNPTCSSAPTDVSGSFLNRICMNAIYDMNGTRGPNQFGKDIGVVTVMFPDEKVVAVSPRLVGNVFSGNMVKANEYCASYKGHIPTPYEANSLRAVYSLAALTPGVFYGMSDNRSFSYHTFYHKPTTAFICVKN